MSNKIEDVEFFTQPAEELAQALLGKILCRRLSDTEILRFRITETEAYPKLDGATHCNKYKTGNGAVTQRMCGGTVYVHCNYKKLPGSMFDIVAGIAGKREEKVGESVLIRGARNVENPEEYYPSCPQKLGEVLQMKFHLNRVHLTDAEEIWLEDDGFETEGKFDCLTRVGLDKTKEYAAYLLRFRLRENT